MSRSATFLVIAVVSSLATPLVVRAAGNAPAAPAVSAPIKVATSTEAVPAITSVSAQVESCTRKVRVVYQGYGPTDGCAAPAAR